MPQVLKNRFALPIYCVIAGSVTIVLVLTGTMPALAVLLILSIVLPTACSDRPTDQPAVTPLPEMDHDRAQTGHNGTETPPEPAPPQNFDAIHRKTALRFQALVASLQSGVLLCDEHSKVAFVNRAFTQMFNIALPPDVLVGLDCSVALEDARHVFADPAAFLTECGWTLHNRELVVGEELALADGRVFEHDSIPIALDGGYLGHLWQYRDITERKQAQAALFDARDQALEAVRVKEDAGMDDYLTKPVLLNSLKETVARWVEE